MSLSALIDLATSREVGVPVRQNRFTRKAVADDPPAEPASDPSPLKWAGSVLAAAVPTEVLVPYSALVVATAPHFTPTADEAKTLPHAQLQHLLALRVGVVVVAAIAIAAYVYAGWQATAPRPTRRFPLAEVAAGVLAFVAWAYAMPNGLAGAWGSPDDVELLSLSVATAAAILLGAISAPMRRQAKAPGKP